MPYLTTTGGLNFQYPTDGTQNWGSTLKTSFNTISAHNHTGAPNGAQLGTNSLQANAVTEPKIRLTNNAYLRGRNAADSADVNILKVNASDALEFGNGTSNLTLSAANITLSGSGTIGSSGPFVFPLGAVGTPSVTFTGDLNTGIYSSGADTVDIATNGVQRVSVSTSATTSTLPVVHPLGAVGTPSMTFTGDLNTGVYSSGADTVDIATNGVQRVSVSTSATTSTLPLVAPLGAVGTPSYTFTGDLNTGIYSSGADTVDIATNGVQRVSVSTSATTSTLPLVAPLGAVGTPSYTFTGDLNTGIYSSGADALGLVTGGTERIRIDSSGNIGAGTTSPKDRIQVGTITAISPTNSAGANGSIFGFNHYYSSGSKAIVTGNRTVTVELSNDGGFLKSTTGTQTADSALTGMNDYVRWGGSNDNILFSCGGVQRALIASSGIFTITSVSGAKTLSLSSDASNGFYYVDGPSYFGSSTNSTLNLVTNNTVKASISGAGALTCAGVYNNIVGATNRDVFVDNGGLIGYVSSVRESKMEIQSLNDIGWLYQLSPVSFHFRKRDENGNYLDEPDGEIQYGMIAEDVEPVRADLCFYDEIDGQKILRGIQYSKLTVILLKAIQDLNTRIAALEAQP